jgi:lysophospholipase L1-like esterase
MTRKSFCFLVVAVLLLCLLGFTIHYAKASPEIAFLGDSLTYGWAYPTVNLGIYGNTTAQMVARFPGQMQGHRYAEVVILGGTNDILLGVDPNQTVLNLQTLATTSQQSGATPVLCEIPPIFHSYNPDDATDYSAKVATLNQKIVQLAAQHHWKLIDYYHPLLGHATLSSDGVHMTNRGYAVMEWAFLHSAS